LTETDAVEVTTFRTESGYSDGRRPEHVEFVTCLDQDLSRRDFTINAMAVSCDGEILDPFNGLADIEGRLIRCVGDPDTRFGEDGLRMFRALRLSAQLGFAIEQETQRAISANAGLAEAISAERVRVEMEKTLMSVLPGTVGQMIGAGLLDRYLDEKFSMEVGDQAGNTEYQDTHSRYQAGNTDCFSQQGKIRQGFEWITALPSVTAMRWCAFCAVLLEERLITSVPGFLRTMRLDSKTVQICSRALSISGLPEERVEIKRLLVLYGEDAVRCAAVVSGAGDRIASRARNDGYEGLVSRVTERLQKVEEIITSGECYSLSGLAVNGSDLIAHGHSPGKELGETLKKLLCHVVEHPEDNVREILLMRSADRKESEVRSQKSE